MADDVPEITDEEYLMTQHQLILLASAVRNLPLQGFLHRIGHTEAIAPIIHPSLYQRGAAKLDIIKRVAAAAREFQKKLPTREELEAAEAEQEAVEQIQGLL